ncbi:MAG: putative DNA binding domain-containing protein [Candidatus Riflebacteria bacterium]|nr:putative DNA binding domain-containing protein [Candidatus Riflebacteria bacterium]
MIEFQTIADLELLQESVDLECKLAAGRDGDGVLPETFWSTYSAFANTQGGVVLLGIREKQGRFSVEGIVNSARVRRELFDGLNNPLKVSVNLLTDTSVQERVLEGKTILVIQIPRATRKQRPVYLTTNPMSGHTFRRLNDGDRVLPDDEVKRMLADQIEDSRDSRVLVGYDLPDLDMGTLRAYRQVFTNREPSHPWNTADDREFLRQIGGWRLDRETGEGGLTLAGVLMFGQMVSIQEELPNYMLDYQERPEAKTETRWIDRLTLDGKWSGNLYDFYRKVYLKLTADLKVPFRLEKGERRDETPVHEALREALANVIVHADYSDRASILVVKRPDMFGFRNPGLMRIPVEMALMGGEPDCRNRTLHKMFRFVGVGEQAGTGVPKILHGWRSQHWNPPKLYDTPVPYNQTLLELRMIDLFPENVIAGLKARFGELFDTLSHTERVALALAAEEGTVNHARLKVLTTEHPVDLSRALQHLTQNRMLESSGGRGAIYYLPGDAIPTPEDVFGLPSRNTGSSSPNLELSSPNLDSSSPNLDEKRDADGCLLAHRLAAPVIDDLNALSPALRSRLEGMAIETRTKARVERKTLITILLRLCSQHFITLRSLAGLVDRKPETLREQYLTKLVRERKLLLAFPTTPTHERQAYHTSTGVAE